MLGSVLWALGVLTLPGLKTMTMMKMKMMMINCHVTFSGHCPQTRLAFPPIWRCWKSSDSQRPSAPELLTHVVTLLCIDCVSDTVPQCLCAARAPGCIRRWTYSIFMLMFLYISYRSLAALCSYGRDRRLSCWYSIGLIFSYSYFMIVWFCLILW